MSSGYRYRQEDGPGTQMTLLEELRKTYRSDVPRDGGPRADYDAGGTNRLVRTRSGLGGSGDAHYWSVAKFNKSREYARDMDRNDPVVGPFIDRAVTNQLQTGYRFEPNTGDDALDTELKARWTEWSEDKRLCDYASENTYWQQCWLRKRNTFVDGDILALLTPEGSIQTIEGDRLMTPSNTSKNVVHGVLLDDRRRKMEYWIGKDPGMQRCVQVSSVHQMPAYDSEGNPLVLHLTNRHTVKRTTQTRGVSALAPIFMRLAMYEDIQFAKLVQQQVVSAIAYVIERDAAYVGGTTALGAVTADPNNPDDSNTRYLEKVAAGAVLRGKKGEKITSLSPNIPNAEYFQQVRLILTEICINLGVPLVIGLMDASETNFSGWRGAADAARQGFRMSQKWFIEQEVREVIKWQIRRWLARPAKQGGLGEAARKNANIFRHDWGLPSWPYIQPLEDAKAAQLKMATLQASPAMIHSEMGSDFEDVVKETVRNWGGAIRMAKKEAQLINTEFPDDTPITWRELLNFELSEGAKAVMAEKPTAPESSPRKDQEKAPGGDAPPKPQPKRSAA